tara:strand:+ start:358 stop:519 length:162 start_codon:yes stop_codon:yes gene_type:complete
LTRPCGFSPARTHRRAEQLKAVVGVVDHGLFCGMASEAIVAGKEGVYVMHASP